MSGDLAVSGAAPAALSAVRRYRAERMLRRDFNGLRGRVLRIVSSRLRAGGVALDRGDLEACYATAWHALYAAISEGEEIEDAAAWLILVTFRRAIDEGRSRARRGLGGPSLDAEDRDAPNRGAARLDASGRRGARLTVALAAPVPEAPELLADRARLRQLFEALLARMSRREREAVSLCYLQGLSRAEAAARMGISPSRMRKLMDGGEGRPGVASRFGQLTKTVGADGWCEQQGSLMRAYALGLLDPKGERHRLAVAHVRQCPACRRWVACLRGLAALLPPLVPPPLSSPQATKSSIRLRPRASGGFVPKLAATVAVTATIGGGYALLVNGAPARAPGVGPRASAVVPSHPSSPMPPHVSLARAKATGSLGRRPQRRPRHRRRLAALSRSTATPGAAFTKPSSTAPSKGVPTPVSAAAYEPSSPAGEFTPEQVRGGSG